MKSRPQYQAPEYRGANKLAGCVALITGGNSGIGRAVAVLFAREGADVAIIYLPEEESDARTTERAVENEGRAAVLIPTPMKRPAQPEEIAPAFVFFASNTDSSYITGEVLTLLGGESTAA
jgi:NAD(P)-dependent dehydrogenase (short-subunit alcohol dehydrogenase family)